MAKHKDVPQAEHPAEVVGNIVLEGCVDNPAALVIMLPGRGMDARECLYIASSFRVPNCLLAGISPVPQGFYPPPKSSLEQDDTVEFLPKAARQVGQAVSQIVHDFRIPWAKVACIGFSAGGVMTYELAMVVPIHAGVILSGAVLEPRRLTPPVDSMSNYLVVHHSHDNVFDWKERYIPTKLALQRMGWRARFIEEFGGHTVYPQQLPEIGDFIRIALGFPPEDDPDDMVRIQKPKKA